MALILQLRTKPKPYFTTKNPSFLFSSSSSSSLRDLKFILKQQQQQQHQQQQQQQESKPSTQSFTNSNQQRQRKQPSLDEIRGSLSSFRRRTFDVDGDNTSSRQKQEPFSFQELYDRNVIQRPPERSGDSRLGHAGGGGGRFSLGTIRESLKKIGGAGDDRRGRDPISLQEYKDVLKGRPSDSYSSAAREEYSPAKVIGGTSVLPESVFGREMREKREEDESVKAKAAKSEFVRAYSYGDLGEKLRELRPEVKGKDKEWFSIGELNERLVRLREIEEKEAQSYVKGGVSFRDLKESLILMSEADNEKSRKSSCK